MIEELDRANAIITDYLSLAKKGLELETHNLSDIVRRMHPLIVANTRSKHNVILNLQEVPNLLMSEKEIQQMILNLILNGLESMDQGGILTISTFMDTDENEVVLEVKDEGRGISAEIMQNIGKPFFTTKEKGTGLGLSVCYNIASRHNAVIKVNSGSIGTIFSIRFKNMNKVIDK